ncbi:hypothetical protein BN874_1400023 [Candidatus Contendobacter odensis Run_B_J11]|uniref:Uncharacterized protein n=1 Tax=Candidatus Contendobacter odensis Run_B_J11 TaxID=1400861 RepID=A0A7U7G9H4_9GAMM|nr:hypothetical protein BN874_1400023 [Candidatus Contendobacter odensis Run_B_J11]
MLTSDWSCRCFYKKANIFNELLNKLIIQDKQEKYQFNLLKNIIFIKISLLGLQKSPVFSCRPLTRRKSP